MHFRAAHTRPCPARLPLPLSQSQSPGTAAPAPPTGGTHWLGLLGVLLPYCFRLPPLSFCLPRTASLPGSRPPIGFAAEPTPPPFITIGHYCWQSFLVLKARATNSTLCQPCLRLAEEQKGRAHGPVRLAQQGGGQGLCCEGQSFLVHRWRRFAEPWALERWRVALVGRFGRWERRLRRTATAFSILSCRSESRLCAFPPFRHALAAAIEKRAHVVCGPRTAASQGGSGWDPAPRRVLCASECRALTHPPPPAGTPGSSSGR